MLSFIIIIILLLQNTTRVATTYCPLSILQWKRNYEMDFSPSRLIVLLALELGRDQVKVKRTFYVENADAHK